MSALIPPVLDRVVDGRYRVESELARGGMATVYRARDLRLDRPVALKVMHAELARDDAFVRRFVREARAAARLQHQHVVSVYDQGEDDGLVFLAMELVEGPTLRELIRDRAPVSTRQALDLIVPVVEALAEAHRHGLVHRDIKPENVLLGGAGTVKVADFGLAHAVTTPAHTATSEVLWGTAAYLAPEQVEHGSADERTDVYAVALVLFELLTGRKAFAGQDPLRVAYEHVHGGVPRAREVTPTVPAAVEELILRAGATEPRDRPPDARWLLTELESLRRTLPDDELDAVPERDELTRPVPRPGGEPTQRVDGTDGSTRRIPVGRAQVGHYARTTGNERPATRAARPTRPAPAGARSRRRRGVAGWVLGTLAVLLLAGGAYGAWYLTEGPAVHSDMPVVVDLPEPRARDLLDGVQLDPVVTYAHSEEVPQGTVIDADADPGEALRHGTDVALTVSSGPERYAVPWLAGMSADQARDALAQVQLQLGEQTRQHDEAVPQGQVISSDPAAGDPLPPGAQVTVVISDGPAPVQVPSVTGRSEQEAVDALTGAGLTVQVDPARVFDDEVPEGSVVSQSPTFGTVPRGSEVTLVLSRGPELVTVPEVVGRQFRGAEEELTELGLQVVREDIRGGFFGTVREQSVEPGEQVPVGTEVVLGVV